MHLSTGQKPTLEQSSQSGQPGCGDARNRVELRRSLRSRARDGEGSRQTRVPRELSVF
jgi:hypothetical protein